MTRFLNGWSLAIFGACASLTANAEDLGGRWTLEIQNLEHKPVATLVLHFAAATAPFCMGGEWRRVVVESATASDPKFFPVREPLSYRVEGSQLTIGRNEICDAYLHLRGLLKASSVRGDYVAFGMQGGQKLGTFSLTRKP